MIAELMAKIGVDISGIRKAEDALKGLDKAFQDAFRRAPSGEMRQEAAISGAIRQITAGDVPGAIESILHRIGMIPAAVGVGFGAIILGATKAIEAANALDAKFEDLNKTLSKTPTAGMGVQALGEMVLGQATKLGETAGEHIMEGIGDRLKRIPQSLMSFINPFEPFSTKDVGEEAREQRRAAIMKLSVDQISEALKEQSKARMQLAEISDAQARGDSVAVAYKKAYVDSEKESAALAKERDDYEKAIGDKLLDPGISQADRDKLSAMQRLNREQSDAAKDANKITAEGAGDRAAMAAKEQLDVEREISQVKARGLSADATKNELAEINIRHLERQLNNQKDMVDARMQTQAQLEAARADQANALKQQGVKKFESTFDKSLYTVDELAKMKDRGWIGGDMSMAIFNAKEIQRLENRAQIEKAQGHPMEAFAAMTHAQQIRAGMPLLQASEKMPEFAFAAAIDSASVFKGMLEQLKKTADALTNPNNPFLNK